MESERIKFLDGFRFILSLWVVIAHFYTLIGGVVLYKFNRIFNIILTQPIIAVYGFMIITGFLMMYNYILRAPKESPDSKTTFIKFWLRRLFRLYPIYILLLLVAFLSFTQIAELGAKNLIFFTGTDRTQWGFVRSTSQPGFDDLFTHIFLIHGLFPKFHESILGVTWSLSLEMQFYAIFPFLFLFLFRNNDSLKKRLIMFLIICTILSLASIKIFQNNFRLPSVIICTMPLFLLGMISAAVKLKKLNISYLIISIFLVLPFQSILTNIVIASLLIFLFLDELQPVIPDSVFKLLLSIQNLLSGSAAEFGANISYSLYLIHTLIISIVLHLVITYSPSFEFSKIQIIALSFLLSIILCFSTCYFLYLFIEKPFIQIGKKFITKPTSNPQVESATISEAF